MTYEYARRRIKELLETGCPHCGQREKFHLHETKDYMKHVSLDKNGELQFEDGGDLREWTVICLCGQGESLGRKNDS